MPTTVHLAPSRFAYVVAGIVGALVVAVMFCALCVAAALAQGKVAPAAPAAPAALSSTPGSVAPAPAEDEPGWDCVTMGNRSCGPVADPFPGCLAACHDPAAAAEVDRVGALAGPGWVCWAEDSAVLPAGFEVLCAPGEDAVPFAPVAPQGS